MSRRQIIAVIIYSIICIIMSVYLPTIEFTLYSSVIGFSFGYFILVALGDQ